MSSLQAAQLAAVWSVKEAMIISKLMNKRWNDERLRLTSIVYTKGQYYKYLNFVSKRINNT